MYQLVGIGHWMNSMAREGSDRQNQYAQATEHCFPISSCKFHHKIKNSLVGQRYKF